MATWIAGGAVLITLMIGDAVGTLVVTRGRAARWRPTSLWYAITWRSTRAIAARLPTGPTDFALNAYPAVSLVGLLVVWLVGLLFGWALVYRGLGEPASAGGD